MDRKGIEGIEGITDEELATVYIGATRYYLGRMTYAVADYCHVLREMWVKLP